MSIKGQGHSLTLVKGHSDFNIKCLTFGLYTQVSDSGPHGPLVFYTVELQWLELLWNRENRFEEAILMSTHNMPFSIEKKNITLIYPKSAAMGFFQGTQERARNIRGNEPSVARATKVLL